RRELYRPASTTMAPDTMSWMNGDTPSKFSETDSSPMTKTPSTVPGMPPRPPSNVVPPMSTAATDVMVNGFPAVGSPEYIRAASASPPKVANNELSTYTPYHRRSQQALG